MKKTYKVELEITLDETLESQAIQVARDYYQSSGGAQEPLGKSGRRVREICPDEFVSNAQDAIMELAPANEWFKKAGIEVVGVSCGEPEVDKGEQAQHGSVNRANHMRVLTQKRAPVLTWIWMSARRECTCADGRTENSRWSWRLRGGKH